MIPEVTWEKPILVLMERHFLEFTLYWFTDTAYYSPPTTAKPPPQCKCGIENIRKVAGITSRIIGGRPVKPVRFVIILLIKTNGSL